VNYEAFKSSVNTLGHVVSSGENGEDITTQYFDTQAHLKALQIQEERLLELLKKTGELKDILELEKELANVRYQIENYTSSLQKMDNLVDYTTCNITITEVKALTKIKAEPTSFWEKLGDVFIGSLNALLSLCKFALLAATAILPFAFVGILLAVPVYLLLRRRRNSQRPPTQKDSHI
jgi:hypothetical protein